MTSTTGRLKNVQAVKDRLVSYRERERDIENQTELLDRLQTKMEGVGAQNITDMPRSPSPSNDRLSDLMSQKIEIEEMIREDVEHQKSERKFIESVLKHLKSADERGVIRFRYLMGLSWYDVTDAMFGAKGDYLGKEDSYLRRITKLHGQALLSMAKYIEEKGLNTADISKE